MDDWRAQGDDRSDRIRDVERNIGDLRVSLAELKLNVAEIRNDALDSSKHAAQAQLETARGQAEVTKQVMALRAVMDRARWTLRIVIWLGAAVVTLANLWDKLIGILHWPR